MRRRFPFGQKGGTVLILAGLAAGITGCARDVVTRGYLTDGPPVALRFAPPEPDPFGSQLPPLPKSADPQPTGEFQGRAGDIDELAQSPASRAAQPEQDHQLYQSAPARASEGPMQGGVVLPPMVLKFFPDGKPAGVEVLVDQPPLVAPPLYGPRSSAGYRTTPPR